MTAIKVASAVNLYSTILPLVIMSLASIYLETILPAIGLIRHAPHPLQSLNNANLQNIQNNAKHSSAGGMSLKPTLKGSKDSAPLKPSTKQNGVHVKPKVSVSTLPHVSKQSQSTAPQPAKTQTQTQPAKTQTHSADSHHSKAHAFPQLKPTSNPLLATINNIMLQFGAERRKSKDNKLTMGDLVGRCERVVHADQVSTLKEKIASKTAELVPVAGWYKRVISDLKACSKMCVKCLKEFTYYIAASYNYIWTLKAVVRMKRSGDNLEKSIAKVNEEMIKPLSLGEVNNAVRKYNWFAKNAAILSQSKGKQPASPSSSGHHKHAHSSSEGHHKRSSSSGIPKHTSMKTGGTSKQLHAGPGYAKTARQV